jgi:cytochrome c oxidase cbb3-type subunit 4
MDMGLFRGLLTLALMILFIGLVVWAFSRRRRKDFEAAARLPLEDDRQPAAKAEPDSPAATTERDSR